MHRDQPPSLLIVEDDLDLADMLGAYFRAHGYAVASTAYGEKAVPLAAEQQPDLIVLDIVLPGIDGLETCNRLRESHLTRHIPIIFLTCRGSKLERLQGLELGVTDYITKPFDVEELHLRIGNAVERAAALRSAHPITGLPESDAVFEALARLSPEPPDALIIKLQGLWTFRELYGFIASDDVLRVVSLTLSSAVSEVCGEDGFCGHLDDHVFVLTARAGQLDPLRQRLVERLRGVLALFYPLGDRGPHAHTADRLALTAAHVPGPLEPADDFLALQRQLLAAPQAPLVM